MILIYKETKLIYSHTSEPSIDPVVFPASPSGWIKCLLLGYLENPCSGRAIERMLQMRKVHHHLQVLDGRPIVEGYELVIAKGTYPSLHQYLQADRLRGQ